MAFLFLTYMEGGFITTGPPGTSPQLRPPVADSCQCMAKTTAAAAAAKSLQSCPTLRPHRQQPTRLLHPWDPPNKNTGVGCHFLLQCMEVKSEKLRIHYSQTGEPERCKDLKIFLIIDAAVARLPASKDNANLNHYEYWSYSIECHCGLF